MTTTAKSRKAEIKVVQIKCRVQFKDDDRKVVYQVRSSNGVSAYQVFLFAGKATSCECASRKPCYHMIQVEQYEAATAPERQERHVAKTVQAEVDAWCVSQVDYDDLSEAAQTQIAAVGQIELMDDDEHEVMDFTVEDLDDYDAWKRDNGLDVPLSRDEYVVLFDPNGLAV